jgi:hypothetical protein
LPYVCRVGFLEARAVIPGVAAVEPEVPAIAVEVVTVEAKVPAVTGKVPAVIADFHAVLADFSAIVDGCLSLGSNGGEEEACGQQHSKFRFHTICFYLLGA